MKPGQILRITATNNKGRITEINKAIGWVDISWQRRNNKGELYYDPAEIRYESLHIEQLISDDTLSMYNELPEGDPNLSFKARGLKK